MGEGTRSCVYPMTHLSLFSGIGGLDLAAEAAGIMTVGQCEAVDYPTMILEKHWKDIPRWRDIRELTKDSFYERTGLRTVDVISGGFPCQPFSVAGKQRGKEDDRFLWPEMFRVIRDIRPAWVVGENVVGIVKLALDDVLSDLECAGYATRTFVFPAHVVGARHRRNRVAIVGHAEHDGRDGTTLLRSDEAAGVKRREKKPSAPRKPAGAGRSADVSGIHGCADGGKFISDACIIGQQRSDDGQRARNEARTASRRGEAGRRTIESRLGGVADGLSYWLDGYLEHEPDIPRTTMRKDHRANRLKCLGNAVVPQAWYPIFKAIAEIG